MTDATTPLEPPLHAAPAARSRSGWPTIAVAILFGIFYAYDLWEAISNAVSLPQAFTLYGFDGSDVPWALLVIGIVLPPLVYAVAFGLGRRRNALGTTVVFAVGLAVVAVLSLDLVAVQGRLFQALIVS
jgi:hypothetical protein